MWKIATKKFFLLIVLLIAEGGFAMPEPAFLSNTPSNKIYSEADKKKYKRLSDESAEAGWRYLNRYFNKNSFISAINRSYVEDAMRNFNYCWTFDHDNYQAYWGIAIVRGIQATFVEEKPLIEQYLRQSVEFLLISMKCKNFPRNKIDFGRLDLANAYNGLGSFYKKISKNEQAKENLEKAQQILLDITSRDPENGRAFFLLAATRFYQAKYDEAKQLAQKAQDKHFKIPEDFFNDILKKIDDAKKQSD